MPASRNKLDIGDLLSRDDVKVDLQVSTSEDDKEKALRLRKDFLGFIVKELAPYVLAMGFIVAIGWYCFTVLNRSASTTEEKQRAWSGLSAILGLVVGVITGKGIK